MAYPDNMQFGRSAPVGSPYYRQNSFLPKSVLTDQRIVAGINAKLVDAYKFAREEMKKLDDQQAPLTAKVILDDMETNLEDMQNDPQIIEDRWLEDA
ncbi:hypothetical protein J2D73_20000 [Acetobacter sacchari]|uniref:Uncharacterized protein n=1 Tax=Acetobacter sacchari TaxID=2661687 RepID=A0ABS3M1K3_9PROT|nr:hypothetical protein [Acetobacter sacchari]MBO1362068.1 hypothetical protein [Acetobacter sacchari]